MDAAVMTPAAKPVRPRWIPSDKSLLRKNTHAAPKVVPERGAADHRPLPCQHSFSSFIQNVSLVYTNYIRDPAVCQCLFPDQRQVPRRSAGGGTCCDTDLGPVHFPAARPPPAPGGSAPCRCGPAPPSARGMKINCRMMPGMAFTSASVRKICQVKGTLATPVITTRTAAQTTRYLRVAAIRER